MTKPKLSICIPTYNRARYLQKTLSNLVSIEAFPFEYEIVVSDNCSTDETPRVVAKFRKKCSRIRYLRQTRNVGPEANFVSVCRMAAGEYVLYHADDDMLIPEAVVSVVRFLEQNQNVVACYAPWEWWNEATRVSLGLTYSLETEMVFEKKTSMDLFNFVIHKHVFPEVAVYRSSTLLKILYWPHNAYWAYVCMAKLLDCGDIAFVPHPFYRFVTAHWEGETRNHLGHQQARRDWELYRGGLEYLLYKACRNLGYATVPVEQRATAQKMIGEFISTRLSLAMGLLVGEKDFIGASELFLRLLSHGVVGDDKISDYRQFRAPRAAAQSLIEIFDAMTGLERIGLYRASDSKAVTALFKEIRPNLPIRVLSDGAISKIKDKDTILILVGGDPEREKLIEAGFRSGLVIVERELVSQFMP